MEVREQFILDVKNMFLKEGLTAVMAVEVDI
jgi:hypothetical protein